MLESLSLPTPVRFCASLGTRHAELWLKDDGLSHAVYGGNKARKILRFLNAAERCGASRLLTFGAAGSHHVLASALFGAARGFRVAAVLVGSPRSGHAERVQEAALAAGLEVFGAERGIFAPFAFARAYRRGDYVIPPGGSNACGALAYVDAVGELRDQIAAGLLPAPDVIVVPCGSGGTAAGIVAGIIRCGLNTRVLAVMVLRNPLARAHLGVLAQQTLRSAGSSCGWSAASRRVVIESEEVGAGYGQPSLDGESAKEIARRELALELDTTYTAKAFSGTLKLLERIERSAPARPLRVLYWHTLSAVAPPLAVGSAGARGA